MSVQYGRYSYPLTKMLYKRANCIVAVYDLTNQQVFESLERYWLDECRQYCDDHSMSMALIGTSVIVLVDRPILNN